MTKSKNSDFFQNVGMSVRTTALEEGTRRNLSHTPSFLQGKAARRPSGTVRVMTLISPLLGFPSNDDQSSKSPSMLSKLEKSGIRTSGKAPNWDLVSYSGPITGLLSTAKVLVSWSSCGERQKSALPTDYLDS